MPEALIVCGGWDGHEPEQTGELFAGILSDGGFERVHVAMDALAGLESEQGQLARRTTASDFRTRRSPNSTRSGASYRRTASPGRAKR